MQVPLEISFRDVPRTDETEALIREHVERLHRFSSDIIACRVAVEQPNHRHQTGNPYRVRIEVTMAPHGDLIADKEVAEPAHDGLRVAARAAFAAMERQVKELVEKRRGDVKTHAEPRALVARLFRDEGYGFLATPEGQELYFHRNSVLHGDFERLEVGTEVRFEPEMGDDGPQASSVQIVAKPGKRAGTAAAS